jgi:hypothetical protein
VAPNSNAPAAISRSLNRLEHAGLATGFLCMDAAANPKFSKTYFKPFVFFVGCGATVKRRR